MAATAASPLLNLPSIDSHLKQNDEFQPSFNFMPATPMPLDDGVADELDGNETFRADRASSPFERAGSVNPTDIDDIDLHSVLSEALENGSVHGSNRSDAGSNFGGGGDGSDPAVNGLLAFSHADNDASVNHLSSLPPPSAVAATAMRNHPYASMLPNATELANASSAIGPIRTKRGQHERNTSINSQQSSSSHSPYLDYTQASVTSPNDFSAFTYAKDGYGPSDYDEMGERELKMGDHSFKIPLASPVVAPQLQSDIRLTSTGKPSHARKVPEGHVKRPRNAFILFRSYACTSNLLPASLGITDHRQVSRVVGQLWKGLQPEEKRVWEQKAQEEKEAHRLANPNYRYRPVYRREGVVRRKRRKATDNEEAEEEDRKCEVVARVLLEGRDVDEAELEQEVEVQKIKDQIEGRDRTSSSRSRSRSKSVNSQNGRGNSGRYSRPGSAPPPPGAGMQFDPFSMPSQFGNEGQPSPGNFLQPGNARSLMRTRSRMMPSSGAAHQPEYDLPPMPHHGGYSTSPFTPQPAGLAEADMSMYRAGSNVNQLFTVSDAEHAANGYGHQGMKSGAASNLDNATLVSPGFSRKFSLGRWDLPSAAPPTGPFVVESTPEPMYGYDGHQMANNVSPSVGDLHGNYTYDSHHSHPLTTPQPFAPSQTRGFSQPATGQAAPTYVYLSKADAQNPQIVEHYLSQGFGVSYDA